MKIFSTMMLVYCAITFFKKFKIKSVNQSKTKKNIIETKKT